MRREPVPGVVEAGLSLVLAGVLLAIAAFVPNRPHGLARTNGRQHYVQHYSLAHDLPWMAALFIIPVFVACAGFFAARHQRRRAVAAAGFALWVFVILGALSWWPFVLPSAILMTASAARGPKDFARPVRAVAED